MNFPLLMCPPDYFNIQYVINPWMQNHIGQTNALRAKKQWKAFYKAVKNHCEIHLLEPQPKVPDLVFTANAGVLREDIFIPSRFRFSQRRAEEPYFKQWFQSHRKTIVELPESFRFEGAGDALFQPGEDLLWVGYGFRTDPEAIPHIADIFKVKVVPLKLADSRFYHLDTCLCPLLNGQVMYFPKAFDIASRKRIEAQIPPEKRIEISKEDALQFACNAVLIGNRLFMNFASEGLISQLRNAGYQAHIQPVPEFLKAGGANKCLTLALDPSFIKPKDRLNSAA